MPASGSRAAALRAVARIALLLFAVIELITWQSPIGRAAGASSLAFNGSNGRVRFAVVPALTVFTVEAWVKRAADMGRYETFASNASAGYSKETFGLYVDGGNADCGSNPPDQFAWAYTQTTGGWFTQCSGMTANPGAWHHVAVTRDASNTARIFIDGVLKGTTLNTAAPASSTGAFGIGDAADAIAEYFNGLIDEVRISNVVRYTASFAPQTSNFSPDANTVALYHLDEGSGTTTADASGHNYTGTLTGGVTWSIDTPYAGAPDTSPPLISGVTSGSITSSGAAISWTTNELATSLVQYGLPTSYGSTSPLDPTLVATHTVTLSGLTANTQYNYSVISTDAAGNQATSSNFTFTTLAGGSSPPVISNVASSNVTQTTATVSWATDVLADSQVEYGTTTSYGSLTALDSTFVASHSQSLSGLSASTTYHYRIRSRGQNGLLGTSGDFTFSTPAPNASSLGQWSAVMSWPLVAVHAAVVPTGDVVMWDAWELPDTPSGRIWNPATQTFTSVPVPMSALFCAGQTFLSDGRAMVIGGHHGADIGIPDTTAFDPVTSTWSALAPMHYSRWYPTAVALNDGRMLALGGEISPNVFADVPEVYDPVANSWTALSSATMSLDQYPSAFLTANGNVFVVADANLQSRTLDVATQNWTVLASSASVSSGTNAMYRPGRIIATGGGDPVIRGTAVIDLNQPTPTWRQTSPMAYPRVQHNLVLLPNGKVLAVGGANVSSLTATTGQLPAEMWDPASETWTTMASMHDLRLYHSVALLLPDGRVLAAGGGRVSPANDYLTAEIYSPPYLFQGARPTIASAPGSITYNTTMNVQTPDAANIASVSFIRLPSVTHTHNMSSRFVDLTFTRKSGSLDVTSPVNANVAPPGYYMLFLVNSSGVPSVATMVKLGGTTPVDTQPPSVSMTVPSNGDTLFDTVNVSANASDNVGVTSVQFLLDDNPLATALTSAPYTMTWDTTTASNTTHTLSASALDAAGNAATATAISVIVSNSSGTPTATASVTPTSINQGASATLSWSTTNATSVTIDQGIGTVSASGLRTVSPSSTTTYTVTAANATSSATATATLTVTAPPLPTAALTVAPTTIPAGGSATLSWSTTSATTITIDNGIGAVGATGSKAVSPATTTTYTLTATNSTGTATASATLQVTVPPPTGSLTVNPIAITAGGSATLSWTTTNATSVAIDQGIGAVAASGTRTVSAAATTTYTLTATNSVASTTAVATLTVSPASPSSWSLMFNGTNSRARFVALPAMTVFTVEAWVKRTADMGRFETFASNASVGYSKETFGLYIDGGNADCGSNPPDQFAWAYTQTTGGWFVQCSGITANLGVWHHVAVTRDASNTARIFIDGVLRLTTANTAAPKSSTGAFGIGEAADATAEYFNGLIDEIRISSVARYTTSFTPSTVNFAPDANTVALYHLDESSGQTLIDSSGNNRNGVLGSSSSTEASDPQRSSDVPVR
jgi:concanavalin A-like lectin/glucanase superfamily protein/galactose oxidase-like protein/Big-like domain-containing protein/purple acid phosphatase-like protein/Kelch motif protein